MCLGFRPLGVSLLFLCFLGITLMIVGVILMYFIPQHLSEPVIRFNEYASRWSAEHIQEFSKFKFRVNASLTDSDYQYFYLEANRKSEDYKDHFKDLKAYTPLKYSISNPSLFRLPILYQSHTEIHLSYEYEYDDSSKATTRPFSLVQTQQHLQRTQQPLSQVIGLPNNDNNYEKLKSSSAGAQTVFYSDDLSTAYAVGDSDGPDVNQKLFLTRPFFEDKDCTYGFWHKGQCNLLYKLKAICVKVKIVGEDLVLDKTYGGIGCEPTDSFFLSVLPAWSCAKYVIHILKNNSTLTNQTVMFDDFDILVRSEHDPHIFAEYITNGTLNFSDLENEPSFWTMNRLYFIYGSIAIGGVCFFGSLLLIVVFMLVKRTRSWMIDELTEEHQHLLESKSIQRKYNRTDVSKLMFPTSVSETLE